MKNASQRIFLASIAFMLILLALAYTILRMPGNDPISTKVSQQPQANLAISLTANVNFIRAGSNITYTIKVSNLGPDVATEITVRNSLPTSLRIVSCEGNQPGPCKREGNGFTVTYTDLAPDKTGTIQLDAQLVSADVCILSSAVTVKAATPDPDDSNNSATLITPVAGDLFIRSAASFFPTICAPEFLAAGFGTNLAIASMVTIKDSAGIMHSIPPPFVLLTNDQVRFLIPAATALGCADVTLTRSDNTTSQAKAEIKMVAPGVFTMSDDGEGVPVGYALKFDSNNNWIGAQPIAKLNGGKWETKSIDLGSSTDQAFLILSGTGIRKRSSLAAVTISIDSVTLPSANVIYAGDANGAPGYDQVNVLLPYSLAGKGEKDLVLTVDGWIANTVRVNIQ